MGAELGQCSAGSAACRLNWSEAFLRQARSDLCVYRLLQERGSDKCHSIHYLQMSGEKLAKSETDEAKRNMQPGLTHYGLSKWLRALSVSNADSRTLGYKSRIDYRSAHASLLASAAAIEQLAPKIANDRSKGLGSFMHWNGVGVNAEYPWGRVGDPPIAPTDYAFGEPELDDLRLLRLAMLIDARIAQKLDSLRVLPS